MGSLIRPTTIQDETQIIDFLARIFPLADHATLVDPSLLRWKYWEPRLDCPDPRSFVLERDGRIVAHVGLWPVTVRIGGNRERGVNMIDWSSDPLAPGAGLSLLQRMTRSYDFVYSIGGSEMTQTILPKFGFRTVAQTLSWARPIRPWRQMLHHQSRDLRLPLRLARNIWWSRTPARAIARGWAAVEAGAGAGPDFPAERDDAFFRYLQQCPAARCLTFHILSQSRKVGFFALSILREQTRITGVWLEDPSPENWRTAFHLAQEAALRHTDTSEIIATGATEASARAAGEAGMRLRGSLPVFLFRKSGGTDAVPLQFQLSDHDAFFRGGRLADFWT
jgi:hypothetical protein